MTMTPIESSKRWTPRRLALAAVLAVVAVAGFTSAAMSIRNALHRARGTEPLYGPELIQTQVNETEALNFENLTIPREQILPGGPPKDGIPSLTDPKTVPVAEAGFLSPEDRIVGVTVNGQSRAYPIAVLNYHEIINDRLGGEAIAVIYCPLCDSASVVDRTLDGTTYEFGISGLLYNSNVLFYDRTDQALWSQIGFEAVSGPNAGRSLPHRDDWELTTFGSWRAEHPESSVVSFDTGHPRRYGSNPYQDYFNQPHPNSYFARFIEIDDRLPPKARVLGVQVGDQARAYPLDALADRDETTLEDSVGGQSISLSYDPETDSVRVLDLPEGAKAVHTFWYAWAAFHPETDLFGGSTAEQSEPAPASSPDGAEEPEKTETPG